MHLNVAVVSGILTNEPIHRTLADGSTVVQFDLSTRVDRAGRVVAVSVPVSWTDPTPAAVAALRVGDDVVAIGRVERRFFRSGGSTQSRTELVVQRCVPARRAATVRSMLATAASTIAA